MNISIENINFIFIGFFLASSIIQIYIFCATEKNIIQPLLAFLGLFAALNLYNTTHLYFSTNIEEIVPHYRVIVGLYTLEMIIIIWIIYLFNDRNFKILYYSIVAILIFIFSLNIVLPNGLIYEQINGLIVVYQTSKEKYHIVSGIENSFYKPLALFFYILMFIFMILSVIKLKTQQAPRRKSISLSFLTIIFVAINVYDVLVDLGLIHFIYLSEHFILPIILLLNFDTALDIKEKKRVELKLKNTEENFNSMIIDVHLIVIGLDLKGTTNFANPYFLSLTNYKLDDIIGKNFMTIFIPSDDQPRISDFFSDILCGSNYLHYENKILTRNKEIRFIAWSNVKIRGAGDKLERVYSIGTDITERMQSRKELEQAYDEIKMIKFKLEEENTYLKETLIPENDKTSSLIGKSNAMRYINLSINEVAPTDSNVLIEGETGVGKENVALAIHKKSLRKKKPFILVDCSTLPKTLIESELFGHEKGAYTGAEKQRVGRFEIAEGGTLFLDEIGELPLELQPKLLRVLQSGQFEKLGSNKTIHVDVRILAATNRDLRKASSEGIFRSDLYYRLAVFPITVPPLRERKEDIPDLVYFFIKEFCHRLGKDELKLSLATLKVLQNYSWPGNIRELRNVIERSVIISKQNKLILRDRLEESFTEMKNNLLSLEEIEREHILKILNNHDWKISGKNSAAFTLKINEATLRSRMKKLGIVKEIKRV
jgi:PAS domain S-box-containing protein